MKENEWVECPHCHGKKKEFPDCEECNGYGWVEDPEDGGTMTCPACNDETCSECNGEGEVQSNKASSGLATTSAENDRIENELSELGHPSRRPANR